MTTLQQIVTLIKRYKILSVFVALLLIFGICKAAELLTPPKEIALILGEPWKDMQARSSAEIADDIPDEIWYRTPKELASLRFVDAQYGFVTPPAKFFTVGFNRGKIDSVRISPQVEPLPLQEALDVMLDLQEQWKKAGWILTDPEEPAYENTSEWKTRISECRSNATFWHVLEKYQITAGIACFGDSRNPTEQRFLINLSIGKHWYKPWEYNFPLKQKSELE